MIQSVHQSIHSVCRFFTSGGLSLDIPPPRADPPSIQPHAVPTLPSDTQAGDDY
jgi:hypothetical protein